MGDLGKLIVDNGFKNLPSNKSPNLVTLDTERLGPGTRRGQHQARAAQLERRFRSLVHVQGELERLQSAWLLELKVAQRNEKLPNFLLKSAILKISQKLTNFWYNYVRKIAAKPLQQTNLDTLIIE